MNNETLKRDLCARLPYGVNLKGFGLLTAVSSEREYTHYYAQKYNGSRQKTSVSNPIPYLFPTSALTKPIQLANYNNGEPFVPVVEITTEANKREESSEYYSFIYEVRDNWIHLSRGSYDDYERIPIWDIENKCSNAPNWIIELLNQWHINFRLNHDQFIEVTEEFNPYK